MFKAPFALRNKLKKYGAHLINTNIEIRNCLNTYINNIFIDF